MSRDVLVRGGLVTFLDRGKGDVTGLPAGASLFGKADWCLLIGEPAEGETFEQREAAYIKSMGWTIPNQDTG